MTDILSIGSSGLTAYRKLLETTGNNIANANTDGYVRRDVVLASVGEAAMMPTAKITASGSGVTVDLVRRASDAFLQSQVRTAIARDARAQTLSNGLIRLEKSVVAPEHNIGSTVEEFFARMQDLTLSPSSAAMRLTLIDAGQRVAERFRVTATNIRDEVVSTEASMQTTFENINTITAQLASLNREISRSGTGQQKLNDLLDQRDKLLKDVSKLTTVTVTEKTSGEVTVYLGDSPSGPKLVDFDTSKDLGMEVDGDRVNFIYDPYGLGTLTNQVTSGALAGLSDFRSETLALLASVNRLAVGLANAVNAQHHQGIDLKGATGKDLFTNNSLIAVPAGLSQGTAKVNVTIETAADLKDENYTLRFDKAKDQWTVRGDKLGSRVTGPMPLTIDGLVFSIEGTPSDGDVFITKPLADAAAAMQFLTDDPTAIAASMPLYVDPASSNAGSGLLNLRKWDIAVPPPPSPPVMTSLYDPLIGDTLSFRRDGSAFTIPSGSKDVILSSLGNVSAAHFTPEHFIITSVVATGSPQLTVQSRAANPAVETTYIARFDGSKGQWIVTSDQTGKMAYGDAVVSLDGNEFVFSDVAQDGDTFRIDSFSSFSKRLEEDIKLTIKLSTDNTAPADIIIPLRGDDTSPYGMADAINAAVQSLGYDGKLFASVANGTLTLNALAGYTVNSATLEGIDTSLERLSMKARIERPMAAASLHVLTTEGIELLTEEMAGWRGVDMSRHTSPIKIASLGPADDPTLSIRINGEPLRDAALRGDDGSVTAGGVYALDVEGMRPVRLAGETILGQDNNGIIDALFGALNAQSATRSWSSDTINFSSLTMEEGRFRITVDGQANDVTFRRAKDDKGNDLSTGNFEIDGPSGLTIAVISDSATTGHIVFTLPKKLQTNAQNIEVTGADRLLLGFENPPKARLTAAGPITATSAQTIKMDLGDGQILSVSVTPIPGGYLNGLSWRMVDGRLSFESPTSSMKIISVNENDRDAAKALGFFGTDLDPSIILDEHGMKELRLKSTAAQTADFADGSVSVSRIGSTIRIHDAVYEDLIVSLGTDTADSRRMIATQFSPELKRLEPKLGDLTVEITNSSQLKIIDGVSGKTVALRNYVIGEPIQYLGLSFTMQAPISKGDRFNIKWDDSRTGDNRNILAMTQLQNGSIFGSKRGSFQDIYASTAAKLGNVSQSAATDQSVASKAVSDLQSAYDSKTGVSLDKEASDLIRYQQAYQAAAQIVMAARTMFDTILRAF
jgi:flagellar hook-associated protein FlgK